MVVGVTKSSKPPLEGQLPATKITLQPSGHGEVTALSEQRLQANY